MSIAIDHAFVRGFAKRIRKRTGKDVKHTEIIEDIAGTLGWKGDALMHALKGAETVRSSPDPIHVPLVPRALEHGEAVFGLICRERSWSNWHLGLLGAFSDVFEDGYGRLSAPKEIAELILRNGIFAAAMSVLDKAIDDRRRKGADVASLLMDAASTAAAMHGGSARPDGLALRAVERQVVRMRDGERTEGLAATGWDMRMFEGYWEGPAPEIAKLIRSGDQDSRWHMSLPDFFADTFADACAKSVPVVRIANLIRGNHIFVEAMATLGDVRANRNERPVDVASLLRRVAENGRIESDGCKADMLSLSSLEAYATRLDAVGLAKASGDGRPVAEVATESLGTVVDEALAASRSGDDLFVKDVAAALRRRLGILVGTRAARKVVDAYRDRVVMANATKLPSVRGSDGFEGALSLIEDVIERLDDMTPSPIRVGSSAGMGSKRDRPYSFGSMIDDALGRSADRDVRFVKDVADTLRRKLSAADRITSAESLAWAFHGEVSAYADMAPTPPRPEHVGPALDLVAAVAKAIGAISKDPSEVKVRNGLIAYRSMPAS